MNPGTSQYRNPHHARSSTVQTGPLKLTLEGRSTGASGEWLLREFAKANERGNCFAALQRKRPWWQLW